VAARPEIEEDVMSRDLIRPSGVVRTGWSALRTVWAQAPTRIWGALARLLAALSGGLLATAEAAEATAKRLAVAGNRMETAALRARCRARGVPVGAELAGEAWQGERLLPVVPSRPAPPPIPLDAQVPAADEERQWRALLENAKKSEPADDEWEAALWRAKQVATQRPVETARSRPAGLGHRGLSRAAEMARRSEGERRR
jgi:hypothetical protein